LWPRRRARNLRVLIVDQFEQILTLSGDDDTAGRDSFVMAVLSAATPPSCQHAALAALVVLGVREGMGTGLATGQF